MEKRSEESPLEYYGNEIILLPRGNTLKLAKAFGITHSYVSQVLRGSKRGPVARKIRHVAITQYDGVVVMPVNKVK